MQCNISGRQVETYRAGCIEFKGDPDIAFRDSEGRLHIKNISKYNCGNCKHGQLDKILQRRSGTRGGFKNGIYREVNHGL